MFEKSLYDLIRGLRNHKGNEKEYIQNSLKECRIEVKGSDMDLKATALLKLVYLEMFGHDMSWASFHVLEVMSSPKYLQKRVGYLAAVQSFRTDTEVLMLATNMLKKDLGSSSITTMTLPMITLPHVITSSLAMSVLSDLLPRLTHSSPNIRKKTVVTVYRLALVYPETLRPAWPKIKERLMDEHEDASVTAAIVNVVCELGWRRPRDFLPLAPRLFELLVEGGNNWMAIKLIKLFATLTPLEPRLVKKLLPPLTSIIRTTPAMSLLYECINGIILGGILNTSDDTVGGDEIASLCVNKLRGMIMVEGDANLKYVALLAFNKIVVTHAYLVAQQEDVIMNCLDSADISIRLRALDLVVGMVNSDNLMSVVGRLMRQLRRPSTAKTTDVPQNDLLAAEAIEPAADSDDEAPEASIKNAPTGQDWGLQLPDDYKVDVTNRILEMCSSNNYSNVVDFDWYVDILVQLVRNAPVASHRSASQSRSTYVKDDEQSDVSERIGNELRNIVVKVKELRTNATRAAESIVVACYNGTMSATKAVLRPISWIVGEYATHLMNPEDTLTALLQLVKSSPTAEATALYIQAIPKIFVLLAGDSGPAWSRERKTMLSLLMARVIHSLEPLVTHPDLEVQQRAVEFVELLKLAAEASAAQETSSGTDAEDAPLLLTQAIPSLFMGYELNSVAADAQKNVPQPTQIDLDEPISDRLNELLSSAELLHYSENDAGDEFEVYYHQRSSFANAASQPAINRLATKDDEAVQSYQSSEDSYLDPDIVARRRAERKERNKDDPFYIAGNDQSSGTSTPIHNIIRNDNGSDLDVDSIPIMKLDIGKSASAGSKTKKTKSSQSTVPRQRIHIAADETVGNGASTPRTEESDGPDGALRAKASRQKQSLLFVDSSSIGAFSLEGSTTGDGGSILDYEKQQKDEVEMAKAMKEVEKLRLEMQRANERIHAAQGVPAEGVVVKKAAKKKKKVVEASTDVQEVPPTTDGAKPLKKKKKKTIEHDETTAETGQPEASSIVKRKKKKKKAIIDEADEQGTLKSTLEDF